MPFLFRVPSDVPATTWLDRRYPLDPTITAGYDELNDDCAAIDKTLRAARKIRPFSAERRAEYEALKALRLRLGKQRLALYVRRPDAVWM